MFVVLLMSLMRNASNVLEWSDLTSVFNGFEDYAEILLPVAYFFVAYLRLRAQSEAIMLEKEYNLQALFNASTETMFLVERDGTVVAANNVGASRLGMLPAEMIGRPLNDVIPGGLSKTRRRKAEEALESGDLVQFRDSRAGMTFDISMMPVEDPEGRHHRLAVFGEDVTASVDATKKLKFETTILGLLNAGGAYTDTIPEILQRLCRFLDADIGIVRLVSGERYCFQRGGVDTGTGVSEEETGLVVVPGSYQAGSVSAILAEQIPSMQEFLDGIREADEITSSGSFWSGNVTEYVGNIGANVELPGVIVTTSDRGYESVALIQIRIASKAMGWLYLGAYAEEAFSSDTAVFLEGLGEGIGVALARKESDDALREREERLSSIFMASPVGIGVVIDGLIVEVNDRMSELTGKSRSDLLGSPEWNLFAERREFRRAITSVDEQMAKFGRALVETRWATADGRETEVVLSYAALRSKDDPEGRIFTALDISDKARAAEERQRLEEELDWALRMGSTGELTQGIVHDFNNLLQIIRGNTDFMLREMEASHSRWREDLSDVKQAAERAAELTEQIVRFSQQGTFQLSPINMSVVVKAHAEMLRRTVGEAITLKIEGADAPHMVLADPGQMEHLVINLGLNAKQAMPRKGTLTISLTDVTVSESSPSEWEGVEPGCYVCVSFADTGCPVPEEIGSRIFEPFFAIPDGGRRTGLGLSAVNRIVDRHHGAIRYRNPATGGTVFSILIPASEEEAEELDWDVAENDTDSDEITILVAEDEPGVRKLVVRLLKRQGYRVIEASDGAEAIGAIKHHRGVIDLALLDVIMPGVGGQQVYEEIQATGEGTPVLFCSGYSQSLVDAETFPEGTVLLQKPYSPGALIEAVERMLDRGKSV